MNLFAHVILCLALKSRRSYLCTVYLKTFNMSDENIICVFGNCAVSLNELTNISQKGINFLLEAATDRNDEVALKLFNAKENNTWDKVKFHKNCRISYIDKKRREALKRPSYESHASDQVSEKIAKSVESEFNWQKQCFICCKGDQKKKDDFTRVTSKGEEIRQNILCSSGVSKSCLNPPLKNYLHRTQLSFNT